MPTCKDCGGRGKREYIVGTPSNIVAPVGASDDDYCTTETRECHACRSTGRWLGRRDVFQDGARIGTVPDSFAPEKINSMSFWYQPRRGDFRRDGETWIAHSTLGPGDLEAVDGFVWAQNET